MLEVEPHSYDALRPIIDALPFARLWQGDGEYLVALDDGVPVGHAHLTTGEPPELQDVFVEAQHRRRGVARALVAAAASRCAARGATVLVLDVDDGDGAARALYEGLGFRDAGVPLRHVLGVVQIRQGPLEVDAVLRRLSLALPASGV